MLVLLMFPQLRPFGTVSVRATVAVKPLRAVIVRIVVLDWPALAAAGVEAVMVKSACFTVNVATAEWVREPLVPVTVSV
jgi:hypothetical protein